MTISHTQLSRTSSTWDLMIKDVKPQHAGVYECQVSANHLIAQYVSLHVIGMYMYIDFNLVQSINPYKLSGLVHPYQLDRPISSFRGVWVYFFISILFQIEIPVSLPCRR